MEVFVVEERDSKSIVKDYFSRFDVLSPKYREPEFDYRVLMDMIESDPILFNAVSLTVDLCTYKGYDFVGKNEREIERARKVFDVELDFDVVVENILWNLIVYGDSYVELVPDENSGRIMQLVPMETTEIKLDYDKHGNIKKYLQVPFGKTDSASIIFEPENVIYFKNLWVGTKVYSRQPLKSISRSFATKNYAYNYLQQAFLNLPPKMAYFLKNASAEQRDLFVENIFRAKTNPQIDIVMQGEDFDSKLLQPDFNNGILQILEFLRKEILIITRVPPHWIGIMDGANRGIGENVVIPYETRIKKLQQKIASQINRELMPKLGFDNVEFRWNAISLMDEKTIVEVMNFLKSQGFDSETIIEYARDRGLNIRVGAFIEQVETNQTLQNETAMSRMRKNDKTDKMKSDLNEKGSSDAGKAKAEEKREV